MPPTARETIDCSQCGQPVEVDIWQLLDLGREPELRRRFLQGEVNAFDCPHCGANGMLGVPIAVHDPATEQVIFFIPDDPQVMPEMMGDIQRELGNALMRDWASPHRDYLFNPRLVHDLGELAEILAVGDDQTSEVSETSEVSPDDLPPELAQLLAALTPQQRELFVQILTRATDEDAFNRELAQHPDLLAALQQASSKPNQQTNQTRNIPPDLQPILQELSQPTQSQLDMPRRVELCRQALRWVSRAENDRVWAALQMELGNSLAQNPQGSRADNLEQAISAYQQALEVRTRQAMPADHLQTQRNLGSLFFGERRWSEANMAFDAALAAGQDLLTTAVTDIGRRAEVAEMAQLFARSAYCHLKKGQVTEALLTLERGKTRLLTEALALSGANLDMLPVAQQQTYRMAVEHVRMLETEHCLPPDTPGKRHERAIVADLTQARTSLNSLVDAIRQDQPNFMPTGLELPQLLALIPPGGALVAPLVTSQGSAVFVVPYGAEVRGSPSSKLRTGGGAGEYVIWLDKFTADDLNSLLIGTEDEPGWLRVYLDNRTDPTHWFGTIDQIIAQLWDKFVSPTVDRLAQLGVEQNAPLLVMPQGGLGLLPLHALLLDQYAVTVAPSGYALHAAWQRLQANGDATTSLLAVVNPTSDLPLTPAEGDAITALFGSEQVTRLDKNEATLEAVSQHLQPATCNLLHFSGHGFYNWDETMQSGLVLADGELTLSQFISRADLSAVRLVTLSACETGITDIRQSPDEFLGLPAVVSTLWAVNDLSTMLLMERFYGNYLQEGLEIPEALLQAQLWLRDVTAGELAERFSEERLELLGERLPADVVSDGYRRFSLDFEPEDRHFEHPYYWAAFTFSGV